MNAPLISIIIPVYNVSGYVQKTIESLSCQTCKEFEIIIVNDGSTDDTLEITEKILENSPVAHFIFTISNSGVSVARNEGIKKASGEYLMFLDGDDYLEKDAVESFCYAVKQWDRPDICIGGFSRVDLNGRVYWSYRDQYNWTESLQDSKEVIRMFLLDRLTIANGCYIVKRNVMINHKLTWFPGCRVCEDYEFYLKSFIFFQKALLLNKTIFNYVCRPASVVNSNEKEKLRLIEALKRAADFWEENHFDRELHRLLVNYLIPREFINNLTDMISNFHYRQILCYRADKELAEKFRHYIRVKNDKKNWFYFIKVKSFYYCTPFYYLAFKLWKRVQSHENS